MQRNGVVPLPWEIGVRALFPLSRVVCRSWGRHSALTCRDRGNGSERYEGTDLVVHRLLQRLGWRPRALQRATDPPERNPALGRGIRQGEVRLAPGIICGQERSRRGETLDPCAARRWLGA